MFIRSNFPFLMMNDGGGDNGGGGENAQPAEVPAGTGGTETAQTNEQTTGTESGAQTAQTAPPWGAAENFDADKAWNLITNLRDEVRSTKSGLESQLAEATTKAAAEATERLTRTLGESLGIIQPEAAADPAKLLEDLQATHAMTTQERDEARNKARSLTVANTVLLRAGALNGNAAALLDSRDLEAKFAAIDPTGDDYASQVDAVITAAVENDPQRFRNNQAAAQRSGGDFSAGNAEGGHQLTREEFDALSPQDMLKAAKEGRIRALTNG